MAQARSTLGGLQCFLGLDRAFTVYAVDRRGRGASGDAPNYDVEREIEDVTSVIDAINQPVDILGHSFGGICALEAARRSPRVRGLILYEPPIASGAQDLYPTRVVTEIETLLGAGDREAVVGLFLREVAGLSSQEVEMLRLAPTWSARVAAAHTILREMHAATSYKFVRGEFSSFRIPTLLLLGSESSSVFRTAIELLKRSLPKAQVAEMAGQKHVAMNTAPELFVQQVTRFLLQSSGE